MDTLPRPLTLPATDGFPLAASLWRGTGNRPLVIINAATGVKREYYERYGHFLHGLGFDVLTYDYRGIGGSRPGDLRGFRSSTLEWGALDFEGVLQFVLNSLRPERLHVIGHSIGGCVFGLAPGNVHVHKVAMVGSQYGYWRDYRPGVRLPMILRWHVFMPLATRLLGYFPGNRLGWLEDLPGPAALEWSLRHPRFEETFRRAPFRLDAEERSRILARFARPSPSLLALSFADDDFAQPRGVRRLLGYYKAATIEHRHIHPRDVQQETIGHFGFFQSRSRERLWGLIPEWFQTSEATP